MIWLWTGFIALIVVLLALDLGVFHRKSHAIGIREALRWVGVWVCVALAFNVLVYFIYEHHWFGAGGPSGPKGEILNGTEAAVQFLTGYLLEESLSLDNIFVIALIIGYFRIPPAYQHRVLFWGILGAVITRGFFILIGTWLVQKFTWIFYVFGAFLIFTGLKMALGKGEEVDPGKSVFNRLIRKILPIIEGDHGPRFMIRKDGKRFFTTLVPALVVIELTDVMFAVDSVPAIFGVTQDPFIVMTSNIFAILGLRSLYFVLSSSLGRFRYLKLSVTIILVFIGVKMMLHHPLEHISKGIQIGVSLGVVATSLAAGVLASIIVDRPASRGLRTVPIVDPPPEPPAATPLPRAPDRGE